MIKLNLTMNELKIIYDSLNIYMYVKEDLLTTQDMIEVEMVREKIFDIIYDTQKGADQR